MKATKIFMVSVFALFIAFSVSNTQPPIHYPCDSNPCLDSNAIPWDTVWLRININSVDNTNREYPCGDCHIWIMYRKRADIYNVCPEIDSCEIEVSDVMVEGECLYPCTSSGGTYYPPVWNFSDYQQIWVDAMHYFIKSRQEGCFEPSIQLPGHERTLSAFKFASCKQSVLNPDSSLTIFDCDNLDTICCEQIMTATLHDYETLLPRWDITHHVMDSCDTDCRFVCLDTNDWMVPIINDWFDEKNDIKTTYTENKLYINSNDKKIKVRVFNTNGVNLYSTNRIDTSFIIDLPKEIQDNEKFIILFFDDNEKVLKMEKYIK